jgi:hypoxanthine phosphoribosyltransferase
LQGGQLQWLSGPHQDPRGRVVLLVDDILDEGTTLAGIEALSRRWRAQAGAKAVLVVNSANVCMA